MDSSLWAATAFAWLNSISSLLDGVQNAARQRKSWRSIKAWAAGCGWVSR